MLQTAVAKVYNRFYSTKILIKNCSLQFELLTTYHSKIACKMSYTPYIRKTGQTLMRSLPQSAEKAAKAHLAFFIAHARAGTLIIRYFCTQFAKTTSSFETQTNINYA